MKKLNSIMYWLTDEPDHIGGLYAMLKTQDVGDHKQALIYYKSGITEIDKRIPENYIKEGYVSEIYFHDEAVVFYLNKYSNKYVKDQGIFIMKRENVIEIEENKNNSLEFVSLDKTKHMAKAVGRRAFGLIGSLAGLIGDNIKTTENVITKPGVIFDIHYRDLNNKKAILQYYCEQQFYGEVKSFFSKYMVSSIPDNLKIPIKP